MRILWINPIGTDVLDPDAVKILNEAKRTGTEGALLLLKENLH